MLEIFKYQIQKIALRKQTQEINERKVQEDYYTKIKILIQQPLSKLITKLTILFVGPKNKSGKRASAELTKVIS